MSYFDNQTEMMIPFSIDTVDSVKDGYFKNSKKITLAFLGIIPLIFILIPFLREGVNIFLILWISLIYIVLYSFYFRIVIVEEKKFRKQLENLEENKISDLNYFYGVSSLDEAEENGACLIKYRKQLGEPLIWGLVVGYDTGSLINVPKGHNWRYLKTKQEFIKLLHRGRYNFRWYEVQMGTEVPKVMQDYADLLINEPNEEARMVVKMHMNINIAMVMDSEQQYSNFIIVTNTNYGNLQNFKEVLGELVRTSLGANSYIRNPRILNKMEVEEFFSTYLMQKTMNYDDANQQSEFKKFSEYATVQRVEDEDGNVVPLIVLEQDAILDDYGYSTTVRDIHNIKDKQDTYNETQRLENRKKEIKKAIDSRNKNEISDSDYAKLRKQIDKKFSRENYHLLLDEKGNYVGKTVEEREKLREKKRKKEEEKQKLRKEQLDKERERKIAKKKRKHVTEEDKEQKIVTFEDIEEDEVQQKERIAQPPKIKKVVKKRVPAKKRKVTFEE